MEVSASQAAAMARRANVSLAVAEHTVTTAGSEAALWERIRPQVVEHLDLSRPGPVRAAIVATACDMLLGKAVDANGAAQHLEKAYVVHLTRTARLDLFIETTKLVSSLRQAMNDPDGRDRVAVLLGCHIAGALA